MYTPHNVVIYYNGWEGKVYPDVPMILLTTLDQNTDAKKRVLTYLITKRMIKIDKDKFEKIVLAATSSTAEIFDMMADPIAISTAKLKSIVFGTVVDFDNLPEAMVKDVERFICLDAFYEAMPGLDLCIDTNRFWYCE